MYLVFSTLVFSLQGSQEVELPPAPPPPPPPAEAASHAPPFCLSASARRKRRGDLRRITTTSNDNDDAFGEIEVRWPFLPLLQEKVVVRQEEFSPKTDIGVVGAVSIVIPEHMAHGAISLPSLREHLQLRTGSDLSNHKADIRHFAEMEVEAIRLAATPAAVDRGRCPYRTLTDLCECDQTQTSDVDASLTSLYGHCTVGPVHVQWPIWECMLPPRAWANVISAAA